MAAATNNIKVGQIILKKIDIKKRIYKALIDTSVNKNLLENYIINKYNNYTV